MQQRGFSLLEILVAFAILALSLGVLMRIFSGALGNVGVSGEQTEALVLAQSLLAGAGGESLFTPGSTEGPPGTRFTWRLTVDPYAAENDPLPGGNSLASLWDIRVQVAWREGQGGRERTVTLRTLRAQGTAPGTGAR